jgi:hypothetical protein
MKAWIALGCVPHFPIPTRPRLALEAPPTTIKWYSFLFVFPRKNKSLASGEGVSDDDRPLGSDREA